MSHQPFEDWLFSGETLESQQEQSLQDHLNQCEQCQAISIALNQVDDVFLNSPSPEPALGFTQRWFERLTIAREHQQIKRTWTIILVLFSAATMITIAITLLNLNTLNWAYQLSQFIASFSLFAGKINQLWRFMLSIYDVFPLILPIFIVLGMGLVSLTIVLFITWISTLIKIYKPVEEGV